MNLFVHHAARWAAVCILSLAAGAARAAVDDDEDDNGNDSGASGLTPR